MRSEKKDCLQRFAVTPPGGEESAATSRGGALSDILEQADWYEQHSGQALAKRWENAVVASIERVAENPQLGASCNFDEDELHGI